MMTDQIPLDLAPPPLLNGDVPLMPHMVNGDAVQQVSIRARALADANVTGPGACQAAPRVRPIAVMSSRGSRSADKQEEGSNRG